MQCTKNTSKNTPSIRAAGSVRSAPRRALVRLTPLAHAVALLMAAGAAHGQQAFSPAWFAGKSVAQSGAVGSGRLPNGEAATPLTPPGQQQQQRAAGELQRSIGNLNLAAQIIAQQQAAQAAARAAAQGAPANQPEGLGAGALQVDSNSLSKGWLNARAPQQSSAAGNTLVQIEQTADKAILNWESFNVGKNTTLEFKQQAAWSVLNRVNDPLARPSQIQGQIKADGTVMIVNRNGIVFGGASQVNTRNLVAAAVGMGDAKFRAGLYSEALGSGLAPALANDLVVQANAAAYTKATADVVVAAGARIETRAPQSVTEGGGYVLLAGRGVENGGAISTPGGQTTLAAGDAFSIAKGVGSDANQNSSTRGNIVAPLSVAASEAGLVRNRGLVQASTGDISLNGRNVEQAGVLLSSTSVTTRGSIHLNALGDPKSAVTLASGGLSAILLDDKGATALDVQRSALLKDSVLNSDGFYDRRDQSLVQIRSSADVQFQDASLTLATGGQVLVQAARRSQVEKGAAIDVAGAVGVALAMASNNVLINVQGNEQRDAAVNRDGKKLNSVDMWVDQRALTLVPAGTNGYPTDRWYTGGGLLEVSGYLNTNPHGIGEWAAQGGSVVFGGAELVTRAGSTINVAGGSLNVQGGTVKQTWLKGADGQLYNLASAPADVLYDGVYRGFEEKHARWGEAASRYFFNSLVTPLEQYENGYTVGRDAGRVVVATGAAVLEGGIDASVFQGERQQRARDAGADGYRQAQTAAARAGQLVLGALRPVYDSASGTLRDSPTAQVERIRISKAPATVAPGLAEALAPALAGNIALDADWLNGLGLGGLGLYAGGAINVDAAVRVAAGGAIALHATEVAVNADLGARGGSIALGNIIGRYTSAAGGSWVDSGVVDIRPDGYRAGVRIQSGATLDTRGLWSNLLLRRDAIAGLPYVDGGAISILSSGDVALGAGGALDASSGAALQSDGSVRGGRGGNVTLKARQNDPHYDDAGLLTLDGRISGEGVKGGGRLAIESGRGLLIGAAQSGAGVLAAGARSEVALRLAEDFHIAAGELIPMDIVLTVSQLKPGQTVPLDTATNVSSVNPLTVAAAWRVPARTSVQSAAGTMYYEGNLVPRGTVLFGLSQLPAGYVVPAAVFPIGVPIPPVTTRYEAGKLAAEAIVLPTGYAIGAGASLPRAVAVDPLATLDPALFQSGFSAYSVGAHDGLAVAPGSRVEVTMPLLRTDPARAAGIAGGAEAGAALERWTPPLWQENAAAGKLTQRAGADLTLYAGNRYNRGPLLVGEGATIALDPGRALTLQANSQIGVEGALLAPGGRISILPGGFGIGNDADKPDGRPNPSSIWIGADAALDVAGLAYTARDSAGRRYGRADKGGTIEIGARHQLDATQVEAADAFLVVRPGARLEASGASATVDLLGAGATVLAGDGGVIALSSARGLHLDGAMRAAAGGAGAAGGTLALNLETLNYGRVDRQTLKGENVDDAVRVPHELLLSERQGESALAPGLRAGQDDAGLKYGAARLGADRVRAGGFDNLALLSNGLITFDGNLHLALGQSLRLTSGALALAEGVTRAAQISLAAPYIRWSGSGRGQLEDHIMPNPVGGSAQGRLGVPLVAAGSSLLLDAGLLDVGGRSGTGAAGLIVRNAATDLRVERMAFDQTTLRSSGDLRFYNAAELNLPGDVTLAAAQIYPASNDSGTVVAGRYTFMNVWNQPESGFDPARHLNIQRSGAGATPAAPFSVFGRLNLSAATINQGGVLRAPLGQITFGGPSGGEGQGTSRVNLLEGSLSSLSAQGLSMPYGGTLDGLNYMVNGKDVELAGVGKGPAITFVSQAVDVARGAVLDLSGGGDLKGAAFLSGRGGSSDARLNPLAQGGAQGGFTLPGLAGNPVYAIVPGAQPFAAPRVEENGAGMPGVGRQITLGAGVPGLPAGTYTLLPSSFALLPGAFRVELNGLGGLAAAGPALSMRNGSFAAAAQLGVAGTSILSSAPSQVIVTPADVLRRYSQYNETSYAQFILGEAQRDGVPRAVLERDAKALNFRFNPRRENWQNSAPALRFAGTALYTPGEGGYGGSVLFEGGYRADYEILGAGAATPDFAGTSLRAADINAIGAQRIGVGGIPTVTYNAYNTRNHQGANIATLTNASGNIVLREGALLKAAEVYLVTDTKRGGITLEQGAGINTLGQGKAAWDSSAGYVYDPGINSVLAVSNGRLDVKPATVSPDADRGAGRIDIGACATGAVCAGVSELYSEGTLTAITDQVFNLDDKVRYGTRNLTLAMGAINAGGDAALLAAKERGALTPGLALNQDLLDRLLRGDTAHGAPALENLQLTARDAINFYGAVNLSTLDASGKSSLKRLVLGSPAMYGYGGAADVARIQTDTLVWSGSVGAPGNVAAQGAGTGAGRLRVDARRIEFGSAEGAQQDSVHEMKRLALGFAQVDLNAAERITGSNKNALAVYQTGNGWNEASHAFDYQGGQLNLNTPLLTGRAGSVSKFSAGADLRVAAPDGAAAAAVAAAESLGAEIALSGANVSIDSTLLLPSGKLSVAAQRDLLLGERAKLDLAGRKLDFYDVSKYSWGGDVVLDSAAGDIRQAAGSRIDLSAKFNRAGKLSAAALGQGAGAVDLRGQLLGAAEGQYDAGGTQVPFAAGGADIRAQRIVDFTGLNQRLNSGAVFGARSFQLKQGDLTVGDEVRAREVNISVDGGALTVAGTINAAGAQVGSIRLAGAAGVTLKSGASLDAHGSVLRVDSYGQAIEAPNRAVIEISSGAGRLTLEDGARMDLRAAGAAYGSVDLNAPRLGGNDIDIAAAGTVRIDGARSVNLNAFRNYEAGAPVGGAAADGRPYQSIDQDFLNRAHRDSDNFIDLALANGQLMNGKLAGLRGAAFHLRPGVQISAAGDLHVDGDLDLSGQRYASVNPLAQRGAVYGSGEAGALVLRAAGKLSVFGSINDGFDTSALPVTGDDAGWVLLKGRTPWGGEIVVPRADTVTLAAGTFFQPGKVLNYAVPLQAMSLAAGTLLAARATLTAELVLPAGTVLGGALRDAAGRVLLPAGSVLGAAMTLGTGMQLDAGSRLPGAAMVAALSWPAGVALPFPNGEVRDIGDAWSVPNGPILASDLALGKGALIPSETMVRLPGDAALVKLRPADAAGNQGRNLALAPMLAEGSQAWSLRLVGGADLAAADSRALLPRGAHGGVLLSDVHYGMGIQAELVPGSGLPGQYVYAGDSELYLGHAPGTPVDLTEWGTENDVIGLNDWGYGVVVIKVADGTPPEYVNVSRPVRQQLFSVLRTGAADLDLIAGADLAMRSPYGVYTAGTQSARLGGAADPYNQRRGRAPSGKVLGASLSDALYEPLVDGGAASLYRAWYPEHGGNLLLRAQGDVTGDLIGQSRGNRNDDLIGPLRSHIASTPLGNWLWRQGSGSAVPGAEGLPGAWWINFGSYVAGAESGYGLFETAPYLVGFTGVGTLGGGNLVLEAGGDAGMLARLGDTAANYNARSQGLNVAIGGSGRVGPDGKLVQTGGGDLDIRVGGGLNPSAEVRSYADRGGVVTPQTRFQTTRLDLNSTFTNLRGALRLEAGGVGGVELRYDRADAAESRAYTEGRATSAIAGGGPVLVPGDAGVRIDARGDLVLGGVGDPGRVAQLNNGTPFVSQGVAYQGEGWSWFSLWTPATAIDLFSAGGNLTPSTAWMSDITKSNHTASDGRFVYPSVLRAVAASGSLYYGSSSSGALDGSNKLVQSGTGVLLAPAPVAPQFRQSGGGQLELLAADSIYAGGYALTQSGADPRALPDPFKPGFAGATGKAWYGPTYVNNLDPLALAPSVWFASSGGAGTEQRYPLFTMTSPGAADYTPAHQSASRFYALAGDIVGLRSGASLAQTSGTWYEAGAPLAIRAGRDLVNSGTALGELELVPQEGAGWVNNPRNQRPEVNYSGGGRGNLALHRHADDVSVVSAGRDILGGTYYVAGPGTLEVTAGRDLYLGDKGELKSLGPLPGGTGGGADIAIASGVGARGADYAAFAKRYLDPANLAAPGLALAGQAGKVVESYGGALTLADWLRREFAYAGDAAGAPAFLAQRQSALDAARLADPAAPRRQLAREYALTGQLYLVNWLGARFGAGNGLGLRFEAGVSDARAFFAALPAEQQRAYLRNVYFAELKAAGREYNEVGGARQGSYLRGRDAIASLFPARGADGKELDYKGDLTMFSSANYYLDAYATATKRPLPGKQYLSRAEHRAAGNPGDIGYYDMLDGGVHTDFGGAISVLAPGGRALVGVDGGFAPGAGSGLLTQGEGEIGMYARDSILLGQSRIFTTFGGNILAWSAQGDINAGRGAKTTVVFTPQRRVYDVVGNVTLSPTTPSSGAGIATLNPIPEVPPGDIDLIAPLGSIDAGEAGIRVSGNVNLAALQVVNAANIQVQGKSVGVPTVAAVNVGALSNASAAAAQATTAAQDMLQRERAGARQAQPSVFTVRVLGFGAEAEPVKGRNELGAAAPVYQNDGVVQVLGAGPLGEAEQRALR